MGEAAPLNSQETEKVRTMIRSDGWINLLTGMGLRSRDKKTRTQYAGSKILDQRELADFYRTDGFAKKVVDRPVYEMLREGFEVKGDTDQVVLSYLDDLHWKAHVGKLLRWDRLYGGALLIVGAKDGSKLDQPLNHGTMQSIEFFRVVDSFNYDRTLDIDDDPESARFGMPNTYTIGRNTSNEYKVHWSRTYELMGQTVPPGATDSDATKAKRGDSILQAPYEAIRAIGVSYGNTESILDDFITTTMTVKGLQAMIAAGQEQALLTRLNLMDMAKAIINTILLDENESFKKEASSVAGLADLLDRFAERLSAVTDMPVRVLMGKQEGGLNNKGEAETRDWYDRISALQEDVLVPILEWIVALAMTAKQGPTKGRELDDWSIVLNPLWQLSDKEIADIHKTQADADTAYIEWGVVSPIEIALSRFGADEYSLDTNLIAERKEPTEPPAGPQPGAGQGAGQ